MSQAANEEGAPRSRPTHPVDEVLPTGRLAVLGFQHVLAMYAGAVAVPLILANAIGLSTEQLVYLINADLFTCGVATLIQTVGFWKVGFRLPIIQGVTFAAVTPMILIGEAGGLTATYGSVIVAGIITFLVSPYFSRLLRFFPPVVTGSIITVIGISLLPVAVTWAGGGDPSAENFGSPGNIALAFAVLLIILLIYRFFSGFISRIAVLLGLIIGTIIAMIVGVTDFGGVGEAAVFGITTPFFFGLPTFQFAAILSMVLVMLVTMVETTGNAVAVGEIVDKRIQEDNLSAGLRADGLSTALGGGPELLPLHGVRPERGACAPHRRQEPLGYRGGGGVPDPARALPQACCRGGCDPATRARRCGVRAVRHRRSHRDPDPLEGRLREERERHHRGHQPRRGDHPGGRPGFLLRFPTGSADRAQQRHHRRQHRCHRAERRVQYLGWWGGETGADQRRILATMIVRVLSCCCG
jgi:hypothetical protein